MLPANLLNLLTVCLLSIDTPSVAALRAARDPAHALRLLSRQQGECPTGKSPCNKAGLPANFCCPSDQQCIAFNDNKSAICCPSGQDCKKIAPLSCDLKLQNATTSPNSGIHSTDLTGSLQKCGSNCCPKGYSCQNDNCVLQTASSTTSKVSSTASATQSSTSTAKSTSSSPTNTALPGSNSTNTAAHCKQFPAGAVIAGLIPGLILGILLTIAVILLVGRRRNKRNPPHAKSDGSIFSSVGPSISEPMPHYQPNGELRNDFLRRDPNPTTPNAAYGRSRASSRVRSLFSRSPTFNRHTRYSSQASPTDGIGRTLQTPMRTPNVRREPSTESIKIYSPPNDGLVRDNASGRPGTTFSGMMRQADLQEGNYLGTAGRVNPRSRGV